MPASKQKCIFIIVDGMGDKRVSALGNQTPLEAAYTPNMNRLASAGACGQIHSSVRGLSYRNDSIISLLMGMASVDVKNLKRGPIEAAGLGYPLKEGDVALRVNLASVKPTASTFIVTDRRAGRSGVKLDELTSDLEQMDLGDGIISTFKRINEHRGLLVLSGEGLSDAVSDTDPGETDTPVAVLPCKALDPEATLTAEKINQFVQAAHSHLHGHPDNTYRIIEELSPANAMITRGAGVSKKLKSLVQPAGLSAAVISGCNTVRGLGHLLGYEVISDPRFTGGLNTDLDAKMQAAVKAFENHDIVYLHVKAADILAHDRKPKEKMEFLQRLDQVLKPVLDRGHLVAIVAEHTTDSNTGWHTNDALPALIYSPTHGATILGENFGETSCLNGTMRYHTGASFMQATLDEIAGLNKRRAQLA